MDDRLRIGNSRREPDLSDETAPGTRLDAQRGAVCRGDRPDDREPETHAVTVCTAIAIQPLEWHQESHDVFRTDARSCVGDPDRRLLGPGTGVDPSLDVHMALRDVVTHRVVEEVRDQALEQAAVALNPCVRQRRTDLRPGFGSLVCDEHVTDDRRQIDRFAVIETLLAAGEREQRLDQPLLLLAGGQQPPVVGLE
jgi:hypothetical protein